MTAFVFLCLGSSFAISFLATAVMRVVSPRLRLVDQPAARKVHRVPTPLGGGVGVWLGTVLPTIAILLVAVGVDRGWWPSELSPDMLITHRAGLLAALPSLGVVLGLSTLLGLVGLIDDFRGLSWKVRLGVQFAAAAVVIASGIRLTIFTSVPVVGIVVTAVWIALLVNAFNFLDNMNGLSGGIALIVSAFLAWLMLVSFDTPRLFVAGLALLLVGSIAGFLIHNWRGKIFLGDAGSYFLGMMLATLTTAATFYTPRAGGTHVILAPLCLLAVPLYDFTSVMMIRLAQGRSPFQPDKSHFSHRLVMLGLSPAAAVLTIYLATATTCLAALVLYAVSRWTDACFVLGIVGGVLAIIAVLEYASHRNEAARSVTTNAR